MEKNIRVVIFEDNRNLREGMSFLLEATSGLDLIGAFGDCQQIKEQIPELCPDGPPPSSKLYLLPPRC